MNGDTTLIQKPSDAPKDSSIAGVSVRGIITLLIVISTCGTIVTNIIMACLGVTSADVKIPEPLYGAFYGVLGYYFASSKKQ